MSKSKEKNYIEEADGQSMTIILDCADAIAEWIFNNDGSVNTDFIQNEVDGIDEMVNESSDSHYSLLEAAQCIEQLDQYEESDYGLWEGVDSFQRAAEICAAFTYRNAVSSFLCENVQNFIDEHDIKEIVEARIEFEDTEDISIVKEYKSAASDRLTIEAIADLLRKSCREEE